MIKRCFDFLFALVLLMLLAPLFVLIALLILVFDGHPVFFVQERVGRAGRMFDMVKFRSMATNAGSKLTVAGDSRVSSCGAFLRASHLDELPQLIHILKGEMSFVGPRPEVPEFVDLDNALQVEVLSARPGLVDPATLSSLDEGQELKRQNNPEQFYRDVILPRKLEWSAGYLKRATFWTDMMVLLRTPFRILRKTPKHD